MGPPPEVVVEEDPSPLEVVVEEDPPPPEVVVEEDPPPWQWPDQTSWEVLLGKRVVCLRKKAFFSCLLLFYTCWLQATLHMWVVPTLHRLETLLQESQAHIKTFSLPSDQVIYGKLIKIGCFKIDTGNE